ncbi:MAG: PKD domain-containing protein [Planctomycetes bacterium]|nr:PKD domain-containing protein [Planctomycetota bacterium]
MAVRPSPEEPFGLPVNLPSPPNTAGDQFCPRLWADPTGRNHLIYTEGAGALVVPIGFGAGAEPRARFIASEDPRAGAEVVLDAAASTPESEIASYEWSLGDGTAADGPKVTHRYESPGMYPVVLAVTTAGGACDYRSEMLTVRCPSGDVRPWSAAEVGEPAFPGDARFEGDGEAGCLLACGGGSGLALYGDQLHFVHRVVAGDVVLTARIADFTQAQVLRKLGSGVLYSLLPL